MSSVFFYKKQVVIKMDKYAPFFINNSSEKESELSKEDVICMLLNRKATGVEIHHKLMFIFKYIGMSGFKEMQKYRHIKEMMELIQDEKKYMKISGKIILGKASDITVNPINILNNTDPMSITSDKKRLLIKTAFDIWKDWECETKTILCDTLSKLEKQENKHDFIYIIDDIKQSMCSVAKEIDKIKKISMTLNDVDWCIKYMHSIQHELKEKYEDKLDELFEDEE